MSPRVLRRVADTDKALHVDEGLATDKGLFAFLRSAFGQDKISLAAGACLFSISVGSLNVHA